jgi:hypothetical protein
VTLDQGQLELGDLPQEPFETPMFVDRCLNLLLEVLRDVNRAGLAADLEGDVVATSLASEGGGQGRAAGRQLADAGVPQASEEGRVLGEAHRVSFHN